MSGVRRKTRLWGIPLGATAASVQFSCERLEARRLLSGPGDPALWHRLLTHTATPEDLAAHDLADVRFNGVDSYARMDTGLGYAEASDIFTSFPATFAGQSVDNTTVLIRYTYYGDANLNGFVNLADFNRLAGNFGGTNKLWSQGDFTYDGIVNLSDFNRLAANFGRPAIGPSDGVEDKVDWDELLEQLDP